MPRSGLIRTSKNTAMLTAGTVARMVAGFGFALYCAALLGVEGFGKYSIAIFYFELFLSLAATAIGILLTRDLASRPGEINKLLTSSISIGTLLCLLPPLFMIPIGAMMNYSPDTVQAMGVTCLALIPASLCVILEAVFVTKERAEFVTGGTAFESLLRIGLSFAVLRMGYGFVELMWVLVLTRVLLLFVYGYALGHVATWRWTFSWKSLLDFGKRWRVFAAENWMATIYTSLDVLILSYFCGEITVGLYCAAWKLVRLGSVVAKSYTTAIFPVMSRMYGSTETGQDREQFRMLYRQSIRAMALFAIPGAVVIGVLSERLIGLLFTEEYAGAVPILRVLIWVLLAAFLNPFLSHALFAQGKQRQSMNVAAISLFFNLVATCLLVRNFEATGAAAGTVFSGMIATCCYIRYLIPRNERAPIAWSIAKITMASAGLGIITYWLREYSWPALIAINAVAYLPLLMLFQAVKLGDWALVKSALNNKPTETESMSQLRIAVIGCGAIADMYHLPALQKHPQTRDGIVLVDPNLERANELAEKYSVASVFADYRDIEDQVDAVIVATPPALHHRISKWFLERGIHVLCEKPLTEDSREAQQLVQIGNEHNALLCVNQTRRFFPAYQTIRQLIADGELGELRSITYHDGIEFDWPAASPHHFHPDAKGAWSDTGVHLLDTIVYWLDAEPTLVASYNDADGGPEALATVQLRHEQCDIEIKVSRLGRLMNGFRIVGSKGTIESDAENWSDVTIQSPNGRRRRIRCDAAKFQKYTDFAAPLTENFVAAIGGDAAPFVTGKSVLPTIRLLEEAYTDAQSFETPWNAHWKRMEYV